MALDGGAVANFGYFGISKKERLWREQNSLHPAAVHGRRAAVRARVSPVGHPGFGECVR